MNFVYGRKASTQQYLKYLHTKQHTYEVS